jgi:hypothetical protein
MFVPPAFEVPDSVETEDYRIRPLTVHDVVRDYDAVMTSIDRLRAVFGPASPWPYPELTLTQDLVDLGWHQKEFQRRSSFTFAVTNLADTEQLGCVYIYPSTHSGWDADVYLWTRDRPGADELDANLYQTVTSWISEAWPFSKVAYPGRSISWGDWGDR